MNTLSDQERELVRKALQTPGATIRSVSKLTHFAKQTVTLIADSLLLPKCPCGKESGHRGWCSWRFSRSPARQQIPILRYSMPSDILDGQLCDQCWDDEHLEVDAVAVISGMALCEKHRESREQTRFAPTPEPEIMAAPECAHAGCHKRVDEGLFCASHATFRRSGKKLPPANGELCACGKPLKHAGRCKGVKIVNGVTERPSSDAIVPVVPEPKLPYNAKLCACGCGQRTEGLRDYVWGHKGKRKATTEVEQSQQLIHTKITVTREEEPSDAINAIELGRRINVIVPHAKAETQVRLTPEIAQAVWKSLNIEEKAKIVDLDGMWNDYDDDLRMMLISKVLLIHP